MRATRPWLLRVEAQAEILRLIPAVAPITGLDRHLGVVSGARDDLGVTSLLEDVRTSAHWMASALDSSGYRADFSPDGLRDVERFMTEHSSSGMAADNGLLTTDLGARLFGLGCYVGETIRLCLGGVWDADDTDPAGEINVSVRLGSGSVIWPVQRVIKRFQNGPEDSLVVYAISLGLDLPPHAQPPARAKRRMSLFRRRGE